MIRIRIKDKPNHVDSLLQYNNPTILECIVLLDMSIDLLKNDYDLSDDKIWQLLKDYRNNLKEVDCDD